jgi:hypothetical protein
MIDQLKGEIERRTGLPASVVDQVVSALGEIIAERYPQYAAMIGPMLGIPMPGAAGATPAPPGTPTPPGTPPAGGLPDLTGLGNELNRFLGGSGGSGSGGSGTGSQGTGGQGTEH